MKYKIIRPLNLFLGVFQISYSLLMILFVILIKLSVIPINNITGAAFYSLRFDVLTLILFTGAIGVVLFLLPAHAIGKYLNITIATLFISFINLTYMFATFIAFNRYLLNFFRLPHMIIT